MRTTLKSEISRDVNIIKKTINNLTSEEESGSIPPYFLKNPNMTQELPQMPSTLEHRFYEIPESPTITGIQTKITRRINEILKDALETSDLRKVRSVLGKAIQHMLQEFSAVLTEDERKFLDFNEESADQVLVGLGLQIYPETKQEGLIDWDTRLKRTQLGIELQAFRPHLAKALQKVIPVTHSSKKPITMNDSGRVISNTSRDLAEKRKKEWIKRREKGFENDRECMHANQPGIMLYITTKAKEQVESTDFAEINEITEYANGIWGLRLDKYGYSVHPGGKLRFNKLKRAKHPDGENPAEAVYQGEFLLEEEDTIRVEALHGTGRMWQNPFFTLVGAPC